MTLQTCDFNVIYKKGQQILQIIYLKNDCIDYIFLFFIFFEKIKVPKAMLLGQVINESKKNSEIIAKRNALLTNKWGSELVKPYFEVIKIV